MPGTTALYGYNGHGDVINLTSEGTVVAAYYYDEFGNHADIENHAGVFAELFTDEESTEFDNPYRYAGYEYLENADLYDLNARYYDAKIARFLSPDPYYDLGNRVIGLYEINVPTAWSIIQANALYVYCGNSPMLYFDPFGFEGSPRYVSVSTTLNMRDSYGTGSNIIIGSLPNNAEVMYYGNKTREIDGHMWAEVSYNGIIGWVAADFLRIARPTINASNVSKNKGLNVQNNGIEIDPLDAIALQKAFVDVGDYDGNGLECPDLPKWYIDTFTTLSAVRGNGKDVVNNLAEKYGGSTSNIPSFPAVYSVGGFYKALGTTGSSGYGHTGIVLDVKRIDDTTYSVTFIHTYNRLAEKAYNSEYKTDTLVVNENVSFFDLSSYIKK